MPQLTKADFHNLYKSRRVLFFSLTVFFAPGLISFLKAVFVQLSHRPISPLTDMALNAAAFLLAAAALYMLIYSTARILTDQGGGPVKLSAGAAAAAISISLLFLCAVELFTAFFQQFLRSVSLARLGLINSILSAPNFANLAFMLLAVLIGVFAFFACCMIVLEKLPPQKTLTAFLKAITYFFRHSGKSLTLVLITAVLCLPAAIISALIIYFLNRTALSSLLRLLYGGLAWAVPASLVLIAITRLTLQGMLSQRDKITGYFSKPTKPVYLVFIPVLAAAAILFTGNKLPDVQSRIVQAVRLEYEVGELYRVQNKLDLSGYHYSRGYALAQGAAAFIKLQEAFSDPSFSQDEKNKAIQQYDTFISTIVKTQPSLGVLYYLQAQRYILTGQTAESIKNLETAREFFPELPNSAYQLLAGYNSAEAGSAKSRLVMDDIIGAQLFRAWRSLEDISLRDLELFRKQLEQMALQCMGKAPVLAIEYYDHKLYPEALAVLKELQPELPDNLLINYLISITDLELKQDGKVYSDALDAAKRIAERYPDEKWAQQYRVSLANKAHDAVLSEELVKQLYAQYPEDNSIAEQYAYILIQKNSSNNWTASDQSAEEVIDKVLSQDGSRWYAHFAKTILDLRKLNYSDGLKHLSEFKRLASAQPGIAHTFDKDYNLITLRYSKLMSAAEAVSALEELKTSDMDTYNYIYGTYYWYQRDFDKAAPFLKAFVAVDSTLSRPWFLLGNVYFERGLRDARPDELAEAVTYYKKALDIYPEDPFCWFSLAHTYKRMDKPEEALGAFQKVLFYMPAEDHKDDYWGISAHSQGEVAELKNILGK